VAAAQLITRIATFGDPEKGTTVTPTVASAGTADNVVPALTRVRVDARVVAAGEKERVEQLMATLSSDVPGAGVEVTGGLDRPPMPESASAKLFAVAVAAAASAGLAAIRGVAVGGGSDGNFTAAIGVPTLDGLGAVGAGAHADDEYVLVDTMIDRARLLAAIIAELIG
jgi:glutamate carboxypeptidase